MSLGINDLQAILDINMKINSLRDVKDILNDISLYALDLFNAEGSSILLIDSDTGNLRFEVAYGENSGSLHDIIVPKGKGIAGHAAETKKYQIVNDVEKDMHFYNNVDKITNTKTECIVAMPMVTQDICIGVIEVINPQSGKFSENDLMILKNFAELAATAISNAILYKGIRDKANELEHLFQISNLTNISSSPKDLFNQIALIIAKAFHSSRVSIMIINKATGKLQIQSSLGIPEDFVPKIENSINEEKISSKVVNIGIPIFTNDINKSGMGRNKSLRYSKPAFISVPIFITSNPLGVINISEPEKSIRYSQDLIKTVQTIANQVGHAYESIMNYLEKIEIEKIRKEVEIMKTLQNALLITDFNSIKNISVFAQMKPADIVGGDFYDIYTFNPRKHAFIIGDVSGKGLPASLYMAVSRSVVKAYAYTTGEPDKLLESANEVLFDDSRVGMFVTIFYVIIDTENGYIEYSNAGHNQQFIYKSGTGEFISLSTKGLPLGISRNEVYQSARIALDHGDIIFAFTDGATESVNIEEEEFGIERIKQIISDNSRNSSSEIVNSLFRELEKWSMGMSQFDDITLIAVKIP